MRVASAFEDGAEAHARLSVLLVAQEFQERFEGREFGGKRLERTGSGPLPESPVYLPKPPFPGVGDKHRWASLAGYCIGA